MKNPEETSESVAAGCLLIVVVTAVANPVRAWCALKIYEWHVRPHFGGPALTVFNVWALLCLVSILQGISFTKKDDLLKDKTLFATAFFCMFLAAWPLLPLGIARLLR